MAPVILHIAKAPVQAATEAYHDLSATTARLGALRISAQEPSFIEDVVEDTGTEDLVESEDEFGGLVSNSSPAPHITKRRRSLRCCRTNIWREIRNGRSGTIAALQVQYPFLSLRGIKRIMNRAKWSIETASNDFANLQEMHRKYFCTSTPLKFSSFDPVLGHLSPDISSLQSGDSGYARNMWQGAVSAPSIEIDIRDKRLGPIRDRRKITSPNAVALRKALWDLSEHPPRGLILKMRHTYQSILTHQLAVRPRTTMWLAQNDNVVQWFGVLQVAVKLGQHDVAPKQCGWTDHHPFGCSGHCRACNSSTLTCSGPNRGSLTSEGMLVVVPVSTVANRAAVNTALTSPFATAQQQPFYYFRSQTRVFSARRELLRQSGNQPEDRKEGMGDPVLEAVEEELADLRKSIKKRMQKVRDQPQRAIELLDRVEDLVVESATEGAYMLEHGYVLRGRSAEEEELGREGKRRRTEGDGGEEEKHGGRGAWKRGKRRRTEGDGREEEKHGSGQEEEMVGFICGEPAYPPHPTPASWRYDDEDDDVPEAEVAFQPPILQQLVGYGSSDRHGVTRPPNRFWMRKWATAAESDRSQLFGEFRATYDAVMAELATSQRPPPSQRAPSSGARQSKPKTELEHPPYGTFISTSGAPVPGRSGAPSADPVPAKSTSGRPPHWLLQKYTVMPSVAVRQIYLFSNQAFSSILFFSFSSRRPTSVVHVYQKRTWSALQLAKKEENRQQYNYNDKHPRVREICNKWMEFHEDTFRKQQYREKHEGKIDQLLKAYNYNDKHPGVRGSRRKNGLGQSNDYNRYTPGSSNARSMRSSENTVITTSIPAFESYNDNHPRVRETCNKWMEFHDDTFRRQPYREKHEGLARLPKHMQAETRLAEAHAQGELVAGLAAQQPPPYFSGLLGRLQLGGPSSIPALPPSHTPPASPPLPLPPHPRPLAAAPPPLTAAAHPHALILFDRMGKDVGQIRNDIRTMYEQLSRGNLLKRVQQLHNLDELEHQGLEVVPLPRGYVSQTAAFREKHEGAQGEVIRGLAAQQPPAYYGQLQRTAPGPSTLPALPARHQFCPIHSCRCNSAPFIRAGAILPHSFTDGPMNLKTRGIRHHYNLVPNAIGPILPIPPPWRDLVRWGPSYWLTAMTGTVLAPSPSRTNVTPVKLLLPALSAQERLLHYCTTTLNGPLRRRWTRESSLKDLKIALDKGKLNISSVIPAHSGDSKSQVSTDDESLLRAFATKLCSHACNRYKARAELHEMPARSQTSQECRIARVSVTCTDPAVGTVIQQSMLVGEAVITFLHQLCHYHAWLTDPLPLDHRGGSTRRPPSLLGRSTDNAPGGPLKSRHHNPPHRRNAGPPAAKNAAAYVERYIGAAPHYIRMYAARKREESDEEEGADDEEETDLDDAPDDESAKRGPSAAPHLECDTLRILGQVRDEESSSSDEDIPEPIRYEPYAPQLNKKLKERYPDLVPYEIEDGSVKRVAWKLLARWNSMDPTLAYKDGNKSCAPWMINVSKWGVFLDHFAWREDPERPHQARFSFSRAWAPLRHGSSACLRSFDSVLEHLSPDISSLQQGDNPPYGGATILVEHFTIDRTMTGPAKVLSRDLDVETVEVLSEIAADEPLSKKRDIQANIQANIPVSTALMELEFRALLLQSFSARDAIVEDTASETIWRPPGWEKPAVAPA
ncbi:hypothetical protein DFJ77DRAFT_442149 [Powellomyces hirtus]|nr:hypothetical protein DFJ77DRAFT_442149 [Powellomyces hirtus]